MSTAATHAISEKTERFLTKLSVQAIDHYKQAPSTRTDTRLTRTESAGILAQISHSRLRHVMMIIAGIATPDLINRLMWELEAEILLKPWYRSIDQNQETYSRIRQVMIFAISRIGGGQIKTADKANTMNITNRAYNLTWREREDTLYQILNQWAVEADHEINRLLK